LWDVISDAPCSTEFSISRFLVPYLAKEGWALFLDADMMALNNFCRLMDLVDDTKAVMVVKHNHLPKNKTKMDGQIQTVYFRKNWSSFIMFNASHPKCKALTPEVVNTATGLFLHQFQWLDDDDIGELNVEWNWLVGHSDPSVSPKCVHFTDGIPSMAGYEKGVYSHIWRKMLEEWAI